MTTKIPVLLSSLALAGFALVMVPKHVRSIQNDIAQRTEAALARHGIAARVEVDGRDVVLSGEISAPEVRRQALAVVEQLWGVRSVTSRLATGDGERLAALAPPSSAGRSVRPGAGKAAPPAVRVHLELSADRSLKLAGQAPSAAAKDAWLARALSLEADRALQDRLEVVEVDNAERIDAAVLEGLDLLHLLEEGRMSATDARLRISGKATDPELESRIKEQLLEGLPSGYRVSVDVYSPRPSDQLASEEGATPVLRLLLARGRNDVVIISGIAPSAELKAAWLAKAGEYFSEASVRDRVLVREVEAPKLYGECLVQAMPWLRKLTNGKIEVSPGEVRVFGKASSPEEANKLQSALAEAGCLVDVARLGVRAAGS